MKELASVASNVYMTLDDEKGAKPSIELILVVSEPVYKHTNIGDIAKERSTENYRVGMGLTSARSLLKYLTKQVELLESLTEQAPEGAEE